MKREPLLRRLLPVFLCFLAPGLLGQQQANAPHRGTNPQMRSSSARSPREDAIAAYDAAAWVATDAVQALHPEDGLVEMYVGKKTPGGWVMAFGKLNPAKDEFLMSFEATPTGNTHQPKVDANNPASEESGEWLDIARALEICRNTFGQAGTTLQRRSAPSARPDLVCLFLSRNYVERNVSHRRRHEVPRVTGR